MLRTTTASKALAILTSGVLHAAAFAAAAPRVGPNQGEGADFEIPVVLENAEESPVPAPAPTPEQPPTGTRVRPAPAPSPGRAAANIVAGEDPRTIVRSPGPDPPRFVMVVGGAATTSGVAANSGGTGSANRDDAILSVEETTIPARLREGSPPHYPIQARANGVEADVWLEIVVDAVGRVQSTRILGAPNQQFDAAAIEAVAGYRFSPAMRNGRPVRVRMKWSVEFRLK